MKRTRFVLTAILMAFMLVLAACTPGATTPPAGETPAGVATPGEGPAAGAPVTITIWHGYIETEEQLLQQVIADYTAQNPNVTINTLAVPFDELQNKFQTEAASGGGPTLITGPQDRMAAYHQAGLLAILDENADFLGELEPQSVEGGRVSGDLVGIPINNKVVALFYNRSMVDTVPADFDALVAASADLGMALTRQWFHTYMFVPAFGASFFDEDFRCVLDETGAAEAFAYYKQVCESPGVTCDSNDGNMDTLFRSGEVAFRIQGPWMSADAIADLGMENVGVAKIPAIPGQSDPRPWNQSEMASVNVNASEEEVAAAMDFVRYLTSADVQRLYLEQANWIPVNTNVDTSGNPVVAGFIEQVPFSDPFPVAPELAATWGPMDDALTKAVEGVLPPEEALAEACMLINTTNNK